MPAQVPIQALYRALRTLLLLVLPAPAATGPLELRVTDAQGRPLADVVVFLESPAALAALSATKSRPTVEIAQQAKTFDPLVTVVGRCHLSAARRTSRCSRAATPCSSRSPAA